MLYASILSPGARLATINHFPSCTNKLSCKSTFTYYARTWCAGDASQSLFAELLTLFPRRRRVTWRRWTRRSMVHLQWISMSLCLSEIVRNGYFLPFIIFSLSLPQMRPLPPNICQISVTTSKSLKSFHGSSLAGRSSKRSSPVRSSSVADIAGEHKRHLFLYILSSPFGSVKAHITLSFWQFKRTSQ